MLWHVVHTSLHRCKRHLVQILRAGETRLAHAIGIDEAGGLIVRYPDGTEGVVSSGEVSVRGMYGYV